MGNEYTKEDFLELLNALYIETKASPKAFKETMTNPAMQKKVFEYLGIDLFDYKATITYNKALTEYLNYAIIPYIKNDEEDENFKLPTSAVLMAIIMGIKEGLK